MSKAQKNKFTKSVRFEHKKSNTCRKRHLIVVIYQFYRKSRSPDRAMRSDV